MSETTVTDEGSTSEPTKSTRFRSTIAAFASLCTVGATIVSVAAPRKWK